MVIFLLIGIWTGSVGAQNFLKALKVNGTRLKIRLDNLFTSDNGDHGLNLEIHFAGIQVGEFARGQRNSWGKGWFKRWNPCNNEDWAECYFRKVAICNNFGIQPYDFYNLPYD